jgi:hypothetical protein
MSYKAKQNNKESIAVDSEKGNRTNMINSIISESNVSYNGSLVKVTASKTPYLNKEQAEKQVQNGADRNMTRNMQEIFVNVRKVAQLYVDGHSIHPATFKAGGSCSQGTYAGQQVFGLDIDAHITIAEALAIIEASPIKPAFIYTTFSHSEKQDKYRIIFICNTFITEKSQADHIIKKLASLFAKDGFITVDRQCLEVSRIFFGGQSLVYENYDATFTVAQLEYIPMAKLADEKGSAPKAPVEVSAPVASGNAHLNAIRNYDAVKLRELISKRVGNSANPCGSKAESLSTIHELIILGERGSTDYEFVKGQQPLSPVVARDSSTSYRFTHYLPLHLVMGVELNKFFCCPFHGDKSPSAKVTQLDDGRIVFKCYGRCTVFPTEKPSHYYFLDTVQVVQRLSGRGFSKSLLFLEKALGIPLETQWETQAKRELSIDIDYIKSDMFKQFRPKLYGYLKNANSYGLFITILEEARSYLYGESLAVNGRPSFFVTAEHLSKIMNERFPMARGISEQSIKGKLTDFADIGLLPKMQDEEIAPVALTRAHQEQSSARDGHGVADRQQFFYVPEFGEILFDAVEEKIARNKENGVRKASKSYTQVALTYGEEEAQKLYPTQQNRKVSKRAVKFRDTFESILLDMLDENGYATESSVLWKIRGYSTEEKKYLSGQVLPSLRAIYFLDSITLNKEVRSKYAVDAKVTSGSKIIVYMEGVE